MSRGTSALIIEAYAQSLLDLAAQSQIVDTVATDLETLSTLLAREPAFRAFLASPYFAERTKQDLIRRAFADKLHRITLNFLAVTLDHNRGSLLPEIVSRYARLYRARSGYQTVTAVVAKALREDQQAAMSQELAEAMNAKIDLEVRVDPSILGGVVFRYGGRMLDNSIRGRLTRVVARAANPENRYKQ